MRSLHRQEGMTAIGWMIVLGLIAFFVMLTLRMAPAYMEYYKIVSTLESLEEETGLSEVTPHVIRDLIERRFDISYVTVIHPKEVKIKSAGEYYTVTAKYDSREHLFANVDVLMSFNKQVRVKRH
jgi:hypothetical protein